MVIKKRLLKPMTVLKQWDKAVAVLKAKLTAECVKKDIKGRAKSMKISKACSRLAKEYAKRGGMKSMGEIRCSADLQKRKIAYSYETTTVEYQHKPQHYTPDFDLYNGDKKIFIEYKGKLDPATRKKLLAVRGSNPDMEVYLVFEKGSNKIRKGSKTSYMDWCKKNGFKCSEKVVLDEWLS
jgi:predicted nuclease of restriction endonuclease-like RecB superfamily